MFGGKATTAACDVQVSRSGVYVGTIAGQTLADARRRVRSVNPCLELVVVERRPTADVAPGVIVAPRENVMTLKPTIGVVIATSPR